MDAAQARKVAAAIVQYAPADIWLLARTAQEPEHAAMGDENDHDEHPAH